MKIEHVAMYVNDLEKTKDLYGCQIDNRRNVFSPININENNSTITRSRQIEKQLQDLNDAKKCLENRISELEQNITFYKEQLFEDEDLPNLIIETRRNNDTYETGIKCLYTIENYVSAKVTDKKVIVKTYITR